MPSIRIYKNTVAYDELNEALNGTVDSPASPSIGSSPRPPSRIHTHCLTKRSTLLDSPLLLGSPITRRRSSSSLGRPFSSTNYDHSIQEETQSQRSGRVGSGRVDSVVSVHSTAAIPGSFPQERDDLHHDDIVEHLDCIDPQVATMSNLTNAANSILIPPMHFYSRRPIIILSAKARKNDKEDQKYEDSLDRHVDEILKEGRKQKLRRMLQGVWSFLKTPMGVLAGIYGIAVVFWGAAIVFFLGKLINLHNDDLQGFWVEVSSQVVNGLFTVTGVGLIPSRVLDTYRIYRIYYYKRRTSKLRKKAGLPQLFDVDDLPDPVYDQNYVHVLTDEEQQDLHRQQEKLQKHQTWYRPHGTPTHRAFPINTALLICLLNDGNSFFQVILCGCMWSMNRFQRPAWTTGSLIPLSFLCGIGAGVYIAIGGKKTRRTKEVQDRLRAALDDDPKEKRLETQPKEEPTSTTMATDQVDERITVPPASDI